MRNGDLSGRTAPYQITTALDQSEITGGAICGHLRTCWDAMTSRARVQATTSQALKGQEGRDPPRQTHLMRQGSSP